MEEPFAGGNSLLHKRDPKAKVLAAVLFIAIIAVTNSPVVAATGLFVSLCLLAFARLPLVPVGKRLLGANTFTLFLWVTLPLTYGAGEQISLGSLLVSKSGLFMAFLITLKTNAIVLCLIALIGTSQFVDIGHALQRLKVPPRLCFLLLFSYRYIFVIHQEYLKLRRAAQLRCFTPQTSLHTYSTYAYLFGMTLVKSWNRAQRVQQAMVLRGFNGRLIPLKSSTMQKDDVIFLLVLIAISGCLLYLSISL